MSIEQKSKILADDIITALDSKASTSHSSTDTIYGIGNETSYGHVKVSDSASSTSDASSGVAASPKAVISLMDDIIEAANAASGTSGGGTITEGAANVLTEQVSNLTTRVDDLETSDELLSNSILDAVKSATSGSNSEADLRQPILGDVYHEIGTWWISLDNSIPTGGLPHLGHLCSRATYGNFWTWCESNKTVITDEEWLAYAEAHNDCCPYYSYGDGSTTFRTPKYDQSFLKVLAVIADTGQMQEAGLPNIEGSFATYAGTDAYSGSFFGISGGMNNYTSAIGSIAQNKIGFNASSSNVIYGNSSTVTPQNFGIIVGVYAVSAVSAPVGETDAANLLNGLNTLEIEKLSRADKAEIVGWGMPDYSANIILTQTTGTFLTPSTGIIIPEITIESGESRLAINISGKLYTFHQGYTGTDYPHISTPVLPVDKGEELQVVTLINTKLNFVPLKGA